jgi:mannose-6-phosphate isomerase-like protein (cupin superfamily)
VELHVRNVLILVFAVTLAGWAQERAVDPTWLHRYVPSLSESKIDMTTATCHYKPVFGEGDADKRVLRSVIRFGEVTLDAHGSCGSLSYERQEELYFVLEGQASLVLAEGTQMLRARDFTYLAPGLRHSLANGSEKPSRVLVMSFAIPKGVQIGSPLKPRIANMDNLKEETVQGHPASVLYKLLVGPRSGKRDAIDDAYVVTSLFWMNFATGGTNFPHHHENAEEIYLVIDGEGQMVAGSGMDGVEGRYPAKAGDAYYFRPNCTVGFYNKDKPASKAHILAVRSRIPQRDDAD